MGTAHTDRNGVCMFDRLPRPTAGRDDPFTIRILNAQGHVLTQHSDVLSPLENTVSFESFVYRPPGGH